MICPSMSRRRAVFAPLVVLALTVVGCGDDPVPARGGELRVTLDEYRITPQNVSARAGALRVVARNSGRLNHNLRVEIPRESPGERERTVGGTPTAQPNTTVTGTVTLAPGTYRLACTISNHDDLGMWGELTVSER
jgi:uncharacterized cupredoxin-like copper-binding protein